MENNKKIIVFDMDGVIINSLPVMKYAWKKTASINNLKIKFNQYEKYIGLPYNKILSNLKITKNKKLIKKIYDLESNRKMHLVKLYPKILRTIKQLSKKNTLAIITSKTKSRALKIVNHFKIPIKVVITPEMLKNGKPASDGFKLLKKKIKIKNEDIYYIGDTEIDYKFALNSKVMFFFANWGYGKKKKIFNSVNSPEQLLNIFK